MSKTPSKAELQRMIEAKQAELRRAVEGMRGTGEFSEEEEALYQQLLVDIEALERSVRAALSDH